MVLGTVFEMIFHRYKRQKLYAKNTIFARLQDDNSLKRTSNMHFSLLFQYCPRCGSHSFIQNNEKSKRCESCGFVLYVNASTAVAAFIVNEKGEMLVCKRAKEPAKGALDLPGGFVDDNETAEEAVVREIHEELNANVTGLKYLFSLPNKYEYSGWTIPTLDMFFICKLDNTKPATSRRRGNL